MKIEPPSKNIFLARSTLGRGTIWFLLVVLALTPLFPLGNFVGHPHWNQVRWIPFQDLSLSRIILKDIIGNTLWFTVFGYLLHYQLNWNARARWAIGTITVIAGGVSLSAELFQVFCHNRTSSMTDVVCNILGASLGGYVAEKQPATTAIGPWLTSWFSRAFGQMRFTRAPSADRQYLPPE